jgi:hypothetical protein
MTSNLQDVQSQINILEDSYNIINESLIASKEKIRVDESALLECLQKLMPLQNSFLLNIIDSLRTQLEDANDIINRQD